MSRPPVDRRWPDFDPRKPLRIEMQNRPREEDGRMAMRDGSTWVEATQELIPPRSPLFGVEEVTANNWEPRLIRCARCGTDAEGERGHPMYGVLVDDLGSVPAITIIREVAKTRLLIRLRLCNACHDEAKACAFDASGTEADGAQRHRANGPARRETPKA